MAAVPDLIGRLIVIRRRVPSQNASQYTHWSAYTKERDMWFMLLRAQLTPREALEEPVRIILRSFRTRLVDYAKVWAQTKNVSSLRVRSNTVRTATHAFYERRGFIVSKSQKVFAFTLPQSA